MVITRIHKGVGNQMFQYATGLAVAEHNDDELKLDVSWFDNQKVRQDEREYQLDAFNISAAVATDAEIQRVKYPHGLISKLYRFTNKKLLRNFYKDHHPEIFSWSDDIYLDGYFQSEKNFPNVREKLLGEFTLIEVTDAAKRWQEKIGNSGPAVSLHIRRGDYVENETVNAYHGFRGKEYITRAREHLEDRISSPKYFVFSDDITWVKENINLPETAEYVSGTGPRDVEEIKLMSECDHNIIANSSFSWWGAWLNKNTDKVIVAPERWTESGSDHPNITPDNWLRV